VEKRAFKMARIATGNNEEALDIVQDAMMRLVKKYADKSAEDWPPLFHRILQSIIRDWYRKQSVRNRWRQFWRMHEDAQDPIETAENLNTAQPDQQLGAELAIEEIENVIKQLPLRQQQVFMLRSVEGMNTAETAAAMQCSQGSVKTHYSRALAVLRQTFKQHC